MKITRISGFNPARILAGSLTALLLLAVARPSPAADGSWNVDVDGNWSTAGNWLGNIIADGAGNTAYFTNDISLGARTVTLDSVRTNGNLSFADGDIINSPGAAWVLTGSTLTLSNGAGTPQITVSPINNADATNDVRVNLVLAGQGFIKKGTGTLTLNGANTMGPVRIDEGIIGIGNGTSLGGANQTVTYNGGGIRVWNGGPAFNNTNNVLTSGTIISSNGNYDAINGAWVGSGTMYIHATGRVTPGNNFAGTFSNFFGTIDLTDSTVANETRINLGGGAIYDMRTVTLNCGTNAGRFTFRMNLAPATVRIGALTGVGPGGRLASSEQGGGTSLIWEIGHLNTSTLFAGIIQNRNNAADREGRLIKVGTGTLTLSGTNTYTGNTTVTNGVLALVNYASISSSRGIIVHSGATLDLSGLLTPFTLNSSTQSFAGNGVITGDVAVVSGTISPGTSIGSLRFASNLSVDGTGGTTTNLFEMGSGTNDSIVVGGNLALTGTTVIKLVPTGPVINNGNYTLIQWGGTLTGDPSNFVLEYPPQTGTLLLVTNPVTKQFVLQVSGVASAANLTWRGDGIFNAWDLATPNWRNGGSASVFTAGDSVTFDDTGSNNVPVDLQIVAGPAAIVVRATNNYIFSTTSTGRLTGTGSLYKTNSGKLTLTTDNDYLGATTVAAGTLQVGNYIATGTLGAGDLTNNGVVIFNRGADLTFSSVIRGTGTVVQDSVGTTLILSGANTFTGNLVASNGIVQTTTSAAVGAGTVVLASGTFLPGAQVNNPINVVAGGTLQGTLEIPVIGILSGTAGTLAVNNTGNGFRFAQTTNFTYNLPIDLQSGARTIAFYNLGSTQTYTGVISGGGGLHRRAPTAGAANDTIGGHVVFTAPNTYFAGTIMSEGNVGLGIDTVVDVDNVTVVSGPLGRGAVTFTPPAQPAAPFGYVALYGVGGPRVLANPINLNTAAGDLIQEGPRFDGAYNLTFSGAVGVAAPYGLHVNNPVTEFSGGISGAGGFVKLGAGTLILSGDNSYSGDTRVSTGKLLVQNTTGSGTGFGIVTVNPGATLGGNGTIAGVVTNNGTLAAGTSIGTLTLNSDLYINGNISVEVNKSVSPSNDLVVVSGTLANIGTGTVNVQNLGPALAVGNSFKIFSQAVVNGGALTITGGGVTWANNLAVDGSISVATAAPPTLNVVNNGTSLQFSWTGSFKLQAQTNALNIGLTGIWHDYPGGGTSPVNVPIVPSQPSVFFRLISP
jgi:fibronectin-binding autotransporter adhesin